MTELPQDSAIPGLAAIRAMGTAAMVSLGVFEDPVELRLRAHKHEVKATIEARTETRHFAIELYASDPAPLVELYEAFAHAGVAGDSGARVPPLLAWDRDLRLMVVGWLEGPTARELIERGQGERAGELAAAWLARAATLPVTLGKLTGRELALRRTRKWVAKLHAADRTLGESAQAVADLLARSPAKDGRIRLIHDAFHDRNVLDLHDGPGVIDWERFGQGPAEVEAGMYLASISAERLREDTESRATAVRQARQAFLDRASPLLDDRALAWYQAAGLVRKADRQLTKKRGDWHGRLTTLLEEAAEHAERAM